MSKAFKKIGGKTFKLFEYFDTRAKARKAKNFGKQRGFSIRIVPEEGGLFGVWMR